MNAPHLPKVAGIDSTVPAPAHTVAPAPTGAASVAPPIGPGAVLQDRLAGWVSDLTTLHELTERLARTAALDDALQELLHAGAALVGARRGLVVLEPADGLGPDTTIGLGLGRADLGHIETVPRSSLPYGRILDGLPGGEGEIAQPDLLAEDGLDPRHREVAARLGYAASYALPLSAEAAGSPRRRRLALRRARRTVRAPAPPRRPLRPVRRRAPGPAAGTGADARVHDDDLRGAAAPAAAAGPRRAARRPAPHRPARRRRLVRRAAAARRRARPRRRLRHRVGAERGRRHGPAAGLPAGVRGDGGRGPGRRALRPRTAAAADRTGPFGDRPVRLLRARPAQTHARRGRPQPAAGHRPAAHRVRGDLPVRAPGHARLLGGAERRDDGRPGETVLLYTDGLLHRTGDPMDRAFARLHAAAAGSRGRVRDDPGAIADHVLRTRAAGRPRRRRTATRTSSCWPRASSERAATCV